MSDILVVKVNSLMPVEKLKQFHCSLLNQKESGVIVIPAFCDAFTVPEGVEIMVESKVMPCDINVPTLKNPFE